MENLFVVVFDNVWIECIEYCVIVEIVDMWELFFVDSLFDVVLLNWVVYNLFEEIDWYSVLSEMVCVLCSDGILILLDIDYC